MTDRWFKESYSELFLTPIFPYIHHKLFRTVLPRFCWTGEMVSKEEIISERDQSDPFKVRCILNKKSIMSYLTAHLSRGKGVWTSSYDIWHIKKRIQWDKTSKLINIWQWGIKVQWALESMPWKVEIVCSSSVASNIDEKFNQCQLPV